MMIRSRKTPLAREASTRKIGTEFGFKLIEDLEQDADGPFDAELLFRDDYQTREDLTDATKPCVVKVADYAGMSFSGWKGQYGRARWRYADVTENGETRRRLVGEVLSLQMIGPIFHTTLPQAMNGTDSITVTATIAGELRDDIEVTDSAGYLSSGSLPKGAKIRFFWNYDLACWELLDSNTCPVSA